MANQNTRWVRVSQLQIPPLKRTGFESNVLKRDIWKHPQELHEEETEAAEAGMKRVALLVRMKTMEEIPLGRDGFTLGRGPSANYSIDNNSQISRIHAQISFINQDYYITDMGSATHTYVDEVPITSTVKLKHNTVIRLADENFIFKLQEQ